MCVTSQARCLPCLRTTDFGVMAVIKRSKPSAMFPWQCFRDLAYSGTTGGHSARYKFDIYIYIFQNIYNIDTCCDSILSTKSIIHSFNDALFFWKSIINYSINHQIFDHSLLFSQSWTDQLTVALGLRPVLMLQLKRFDFKYGQILDLQSGSGYNGYIKYVSHYVH